MHPIIIEWDGVHVPTNFQQLPPGRYILEPLEEPQSLTSEEENGLITALNQLDAGRGISLAEVVRTIRGG